MTKTVEIDTIETTAPSQELALPSLENNEMALAPATGWLEQPDFGQEDVFLSRLKLGQPGTTEVVAGEAKGGDWIVTGYPGMPSITIVPLTARRVYRRETMVQGNKVIACYDHESSDPNEDCSNCRWKWEKALERTDGNFDSTLFMGYNYTVYIEEIGAPAILELATVTSKPAGLVINGEIMQNRLGSCMVILGSKSIKGGKGTYYVPTVQKTPADPEVLARANSFVPAS